MENQENKDKRKRHFIRFSETTVYVERTTEKKHISSMAFCTVVVRNTNESLKPRGIFSQLMLYGDNGTLLSTTWLQLWE